LAGAHCFCIHPMRVVWPHIANAWPTIELTLEFLKMRSG